MDTDAEDSPRSKTLSAPSSACNELDEAGVEVGHLGSQDQDRAGPSLPGNALKREHEDDYNSNSPFKAARVESATCARWCRIRHDGTTEAGESNIKCLLSKYEREDATLMRRLVGGLELSSRLHPLIFDGAVHHDPDMVRLRSMPHMQALIADAASGGTEFSRLSQHQKLIVSVGVRDLFLAVSNDSANEHDAQLLNGMIELLTDPVEPVQVDGMTISFHPSASFKVVKYIEALDYKIGPGQARLFAQTMETPRLFTVFVDPAELSYHNFENIVPLDSWVGSKLDAQREEGLSLSVSNLVQLLPNREVYCCRLQGHGAASAVLKDISSLDLYVPPFTKGLRGGDRFIFHSSILSKALTEAIRSSRVMDDIGGGSLAHSFEFVNYVFRCNKFAEGDANFESHRDTPYFDRAHSHVSKYTLLLYLSTGENNPVLRVEDVLFNRMEEMSCIIFDQKYEHEGRPYLDGDKIFLRTELVFRDEHLTHHHRIAELFSEACYMTGQSIFDKELATFAHKCFERANALHWAVEQEATEPSVHLHKTFQGLSFMTTGYNYWFPKNGAAMDFRDCAAIAVLDYFNCKINDVPFRSISCSVTVSQRFGSNDDIWDFLSAYANTSSRTPKLFRRLRKDDVESLMPKERDPDKPFVGLKESWDGDAEELQNLMEENGFPEDGDGCCPMHSHPVFNAWKSADVMKAYQHCCQYTRHKLFGSPFLILDREAVINESNIQIIGDKVYILQERDGVLRPRLNFAACWADEPLPPAFIGLEGEIVAPKLLIPPITLHEFPQGYQLGLDFFRNDWMVQVDDERKIPVPSVAEDLPMDDLESAFLKQISEPTKLMKKLAEDGWISEGDDSDSSTDVSA